MGILVYAKVIICFETGVIIENNQNERERTTNVPIQDVEMWKTYNIVPAYYLQP